MNWASKSGLNTSEFTQDYLKLFDYKLFGITKTCDQKMCFPNSHAMKEFIVKMLFGFSFFSLPHTPPLLSLLKKIKSCISVYFGTWSDSSSRNHCFFPPFNDLRCFPLLAQGCSIYVLQQTLVPHKIILLQFLVRIGVVWWWF